MSKEPLITIVARAVVEAINEIYCWEHPTDEHSQILSLFNDERVRAKIQKMLDKGYFNEEERRTLKLYSCSIFEWKENDE